MKKALLAMIIALVAVFATAEAYYWGPYNHHGRYPPFQMNPGHGYGRTHNPYFNPNWFMPQQSDDYVQSNLDNADWICRSPKTGDIMIVIGETRIPGLPGREESDQLPHDSPHGHGNPWLNGQKPGRGPPGNKHPMGPPGQENKPPAAPLGQENNPPVIPPGQQNKLPITPIPTAPPTQKSSPPQGVPHGGEGLLDIRIGAN